MFIGSLPQIGIAKKQPVKMHYFGTPPQTAAMEHEIKQSASEPLLQRNNETKSVETDCVNVLCFVLGSCIACLVQLATLGGRFVFSIVQADVSQEGGAEARARLTAFGLAVLISSAVVIACNTLRHFYAHSNTTAGSIFGGRDFCFSTGIVLGVYGSMAIAKAMVGPDFGNLACHLIIASSWARICTMLSSRRPGLNENETTAGDVQV